MVFNRAVTVSGISDSEGGRLQSSIKSLTDTTRSQLKTDINNIDAETWTPLAETLYEAGLYFKGGSSYFNSGVVYTSPIQFYCQRNYVIIITDGDSTRDRNAVLGSVIGDRDGDGREPGGANEVHYIVDGDDMLGTDYLDDVAKYLYDIDLRSDLTEQQNIVTYTIGFTIHSQHNLLERGAAKGHGRYFFSDNAQQLADAFQDIVNEILEKSTSFVAPLVPVSRMERTSAGDKIYLALFQPVSGGMWSGNIKKFGVAQETSTLSGITIGDIIDANGAAALGQDGQILPTAKSFWTTLSMDGGDVEKGGVGEVLRNRSSSRNIYTYLGPNVIVSDATNAFTEANITPAMLGLGADTSARDKLVRFVRGYDSYDDNGNGITTEKRDWMLGSFLHSRPMIIHYETRSVIYAGANDGMLHAFDDSDGSELWAFIPPNLLDKLQALRTDVVSPFVDGSPKAFISYDLTGQITQAILMFGQRRGGNHYYALDITNPLNPRYLWKISPEGDYAQLGQTWASPVIGKIAFGTGEKWVVFIGGGYDDNQDNDPVTAPDSKGRAIYVVDVLDGSLVWRYSYAENSQMMYSIPSDVQRVDTNGDGKIDRLYVGDMGGQMWRFNIADPAPVQWTGKIIFKSNTTSSEKRKIFYPPDVTLEKDSGNYEMLFFGTGDREHPKESTNINRLYSVKDKNPSTPLTENNLVDVTQDLLQDPSTSVTDKTAILTALSTQDGWVIKLDQNPGEKCLASPLVYYGVVYYTSFAPNFGSVADPCFVGEGTGRLYALNYKTGNAVFNLDGSLDGAISRSDRSGTIGTGMPSGVIMTFIGGKGVAYVGVGGPEGPRVPRPKLLGERSIIPVTWRIVF
jgi:type IV pilus assembly protein PilY1